MNFYTLFYCQSNILTIEAKKEIRVAPGETARLDCNVTSKVCYYCYYNYYFNYYYYSNNLSFITFINSKVSYDLTWKRRGARGSSIHSPRIVRHTDGKYKKNIKI